MKNILSSIKSAMNTKKAGQLLKVLPLLMLTLNSLSLSAQDTEISRRDAGLFTDIVVRAIMSGGVNDKKEVSYNRFGFYQTYDSETSDDYYKIKFISAWMDQHGVKHDDEDPVEEFANHCHTILSRMTTSPSYHFISDDYWFYIEPYSGVDAENTAEYTHSSMAEDLTSIFMYSMRRNEGPAPKWKVYRVSINVLLDSNADDYCGIKVKNSTIALDYDYRNVEIYVNDDYKGKQDGNAIFSERTWNASDLAVTPASGYYMDTTKGSGTGKTTTGSKDGGTYKVYLVTKYTVEYNANGGSGTMGSQTFTYNQTQALAANSFTNGRYRFSGWNTMPDGSGTSYSPGQNVSNLTKEKDGKITLYAQWEAYDLTISITNLQTDEYVLFKAEALTGEGAGTEYMVALNSEKPSETLKTLPVGNYKVTALYWSQSEDVKSVVNPGTVVEEHDINGNYEFKFIASTKTSPQPHAEASINNDWSKK